MPNVAAGELDLSLRKSHRHSGSATGEPPIVSSAPYCLRLRSLECGPRPYPVPTETFGLHTDESFACISTIWDRQGQGLQKCCFSKIVMDSTGCFFNWYPPKKLKYGKLSLGVSTLT